MNYNKLFLFILMIFILSCNRGKEGDKNKNSRGDLFTKFHLDKIKLPPGFVIDVYAKVPDARSMTVSPSGILYVGNRAEDKVYAVLDNNKDGIADKVIVVAEDLNTPNGVAFKDGDLYIATISSILKIANIEADLSHPAVPTVVFDKYPTETHHGWKFIAFGPDGKLYVPVGAPCNVCLRDNPIFASITRINADGSGLEIIANGIRNSVGFAWHPATQQLWFTENGRDQLGDDVPGDELNHLTATGTHFGFPFCHQGNIADPEFGSQRSCSEFTPPVQVLGPHVAALGMRFYPSDAFGADYKNQVLIAEHGSWNRSERIGYRVSMVKLDEEGKSLGYSVFAEGWLQPDGTVLGRPVDVQVMQDGALLVSDDYSGAIYRISKKAG